MIGPRGRQKTALLLGLHTEPFVVGERLRAFAPADRLEDFVGVERW